MPSVGQAVNHKSRPGVAGLFLYLVLLSLVYPWLYDKKIKSVIILVFAFDFLNCNLVYAIFRSFKLHEIGYWPDSDKDFSDHVLPS